MWAWAVAQSLQCVVSSTSCARRPRGVVRLRSPMVLSTHGSGRARGEREEQKKAHGEGASMENYGFGSFPKKMRRKSGYRPAAPFPLVTSRAIVPEAPHALAGREGLLAEHNRGGGVPFGGNLSGRSHLLHFRSTFTSTSFCQSCRGSAAASDVKRGLSPSTFKKARAQKDSQLAHKGDKWRCC